MSFIQSNGVTDSPDLRADQTARHLALSPHESCIVQAPAGSGKTELLIQRLLTVLADADHPSEVLAITFTNKAAGEMRDRLLRALESASRPADAEMSPLDGSRRQLAVQVLERDAERGWHLLTDSSAVLIDTFDAFCARVAARAPLSQVAAAGALAGIAETLTPIYRDAARDALFDPDIREQSEVLLTLAANKVDDVVDLIANLLARRSQWLGHAVDTSDAAILRHTTRLLNSVRQELASVSECLNPAHVEDIGRLLEFTGRSLLLAGKHELAAERAAAAADWWGSGEIRPVSTWRTLSAMLLTGSDELRKPGGVNKTAGFPKHDDKDFSDLSAEERTDAKRCMQALLDELANEPDFLRALGKTRHLPTSAAIKEHAPLLQATLIVLRLAAMNLLVRLRERGVTDFGGIADAALQVLNDSRDDVLASLDARLKHVLVDEVQDTNPAQFALLATLVGDWSDGDGRTLFLVGDPMQSIYGFRDADVGLFADAQARGVRHVRLRPLTLSANYRSQPALVDWVNASLAQVFSHIDSWESATVRFAPAVATRPGSGAAAVNRLSFVNVDDEAKAVAERVDDLQRRAPAETIAILVRSRSHAAAIIAALAARNVGFVAREFASWTERETIRDLLSLTYAIAHPSDRLMLFSVLRSPYVGLTLATLSALAGYLDDEGRHASGWHALAPTTSWQRALPADEVERIRTAHLAFSVAHARSWLSPLAEQVRAAWQSMGGSATCSDADARDDADAFFVWLHGCAPSGQLPPRHVLSSLLDAQRRSFSSGRATVNRVEILTIHKAKGLEWDHVFLPGIDRRQRGDSRDLAQWQFTREAEEDGDDSRDAWRQRSVLIVARDSRKKLEGSVYDYVSQHTRAARSAEVKRLLYVAVTRAKTTLTLTRCNATFAPATDSFSALLGDAPDDTMASPEPAADRRLLLAQSLTRWGSATEGADRAGEGGENLATAPVMPAYRAAVGAAELAVPQSQLDARAVGVVGHLLFEGLAIAMAASPPQPFAPGEDAVRQVLQEEGADPSEAAKMAERLTAYFRGAAQLDTIQFIFSSEHSDAANELTLIDAQAESVRVDRTFIAQTGERWLIDFKFSEPHDRDAVAAEVEQYRAQLTRYAALLRRLDQAGSRPLPIRAALYFPWLDLMEEVLVQL